MDLFIKTPLIESIQMNSCIKSGNKVYLKLENSQPSASFKLRGVSRLCHYALSKGYKEFVIASGGNAGLALAYCARKLEVKCTIIVPSFASEKVIDLIEKYGASVEVYGHSSVEVINRATQLTNADPNKFLVHSFDDKILWSGHSTMIDEIAEHLDIEPGLIVTCCGGGGLLCGIIEGMRRHDWTSVPVIAMETTGTASFNACVRNGGQIVSLEKSSGVAISLSPIRVCEQLVEYYRESKPPVLSYVVEDRDAIDSCIRFANEQKILVEAACGTTLSAIYTGIVNKVIDKYNIREKAIIVIVCGGANIDIQTLMDWQSNLE